MSYDEGIKEHQNENDNINLVLILKFKVDEPLRIS